MFRDKAEASILLAIMGAFIYTFKAAVMMPEMAVMHAATIVRKAKEEAETLADD